MRVCERGTGHPVASSRIATARGDGKTALPYWPAGATDANGELVLTDLASGWFSIRSSDGEHEAWALLEPGATSEVVVSVDAPTRVAGRVVARDGSPAAAAELWISDVKAEQEGAVVARSRPDGSFEFDVRSLDRVLVARAKNAGVSNAVALNAPRAFDEELVIQLEHGAARVVGTVTTADGRPVARARVTIGQFNSWDDVILLAPYGSRGKTSPVVPTCTNDDGTFEAETVPCISAASIFICGVGYVPQSKTIDLKPGETTRIDVRLERGFRVSGVVTTSDRRPAAGVVVDARQPRRRGMDRPPDWMSSKTMSAADGTFELADLEPGTRELGAESPALGRANQKLEGAAGASLTWNPVLDAGRTITGKLVDDAGNPLAGWSLRVEGERQRMWRETDADGGFVFARCSEASFRLSVHQRGAWMPTDVLTVRDVVADRAPLELRVPRRALSTSRVSGTVLDCRGLPTASVISVRVDDSEMSQQLSMALPPGPFVVAPIRAGRFRIAVMVAGHETLDVPEFELAAGATRDLGVLGTVRAAK